MSSPFRVLLSVAVLLALTGCQTMPTATYETEKFDSAGIYSRNYAFPSATACEAARRTLLSQGYVISAYNSTQIDARKNFQPLANAHVQIAFRVVCADDGVAGKATSMFVNAMEDRYTLKKVNTAASLGVGALGSVSLPFSSSDDSLVKVGSETISAGHFYESFFDLVGKFLGTRRDEIPPSVEQSAVREPIVRDTPTQQQPQQLQQQQTVTQKPEAASAQTQPPTATPAPLQPATTPTVQSADKATVPSAPLPAP
ncbi:DUF2242 domain-containing protein [Oxalicibacterium faecigallinarum]|nr:DUF2242 domain-containing protein [Oxalicibacterium faecigallinarum]